MQTQTANQRDVGGSESREVKAGWKQREKRR